MSKVNCFSELLFTVRLFMHFTFDLMFSYLILGLLLEGYMIILRDRFLFMHF